MIIQRLIIECVSTNEEYLLLSFILKHLNKEFQLSVK